jgi:alpha-N-arabinofuranosidase
MTLTSYVVVNPGDIVGRVNPNLYGHFAEHLGRCIYDGIWVGEQSPIPNVGGFRKDVIEALRQIKPSILRWPGGCFADDYHWQDGIGAPQERPQRINIHWGEVVETNEVGTQEFVQFCRLIGAEPYICGNVGSGTVRELRDWVEYCNYPDASSWAQKRAEDGSRDPLNVRYWGVGNENWTCGGNFSPEDYCTEFRRYATFLRDFGQKLFVIACGPSGNDIEWTDRFFRKLKKDYWDFQNIDGFAAHYYCGTAGTATEYSTDEWYQLINKGLKMEALVIQQRAAMDVYDPSRRIGLVVDEWGTWHPVEPGTNPAFLFQQNSLRDALVAATTLDIFNRHADKVVMANIAQTVNVLQAMVLTEPGGPRIMITPSGYVYGMYAQHQNGMSVRMLVQTPEITYSSGETLGTIPMVAGSATLKAKTLFLTMTNSHASDHAEVQIGLLGGSRASSTSAKSLAGEIHAHNTFDTPNAIKPTDLAVESHDAQVHIILPPASVTSVEIEI